MPGTSGETEFKTWADVERSLLGDEGAVGDTAPETVTSPVTAPAFTAETPIEDPAPVVAPVTAPPVSDERWVPLTTMLKTRQEKQAAQREVEELKAQLARMQPTAPQYVAPVTEQAVETSFDDDPQAYINNQLRQVQLQIDNATARAQQAELKALAAQTRVDVGPAAYDASLQSLLEIEQVWPGFIDHRTILGNENPALAAFEAGIMARGMLEAMKSSRTAAPAPAPAAAAVPTPADFQAAVAAAVAAQVSTIKAELAAEYGKKVGAVSGIPNIGDIPAAGGEVVRIGTTRKADDLTTQDLAGLTTAEKLEVFSRML